MENQSDEREETPTPVIPAGPTLDYRALSEERKGPYASDILAGSVATLIAGAAGLFCIGSAGGTVALLMDNNMDTWRMGSICLLSFAAMLCAIRTTWYYIGGWANAPKGSRLANRGILLPWRWR